MDFSQVNRRLGKAMAAVSVNQELAETLGEGFVSSTRKRFESGEGPDGTAWEKSARAVAQSGRTLRDNGHLMDSISYEASPTSVAVGTTDSIKGAIHQFGGTIKPKKVGGRLKFRTPTGFASVEEVEMPARPYIGLNQEDIDEAAEAIRLFMERGLGIR